MDLTIGVSISILGRNVEHRLLLYEYKMAKGFETINWKVGTGFLDASLKNELSAAFVA